MGKNENIAIKGNRFTFWNDVVFMIILVSIILLPVIFYPYIVTTFVPIKNLTLQLTALLGLTIWVLRIILTENICWQINNLNKPIFLYLLTGCFSLIWSINIFNSILALPLFLAGPVLFYVITNSIGERKTIDRLLCAIIIMGLGMGIYGILQFAGIDFKFWEGNIGRERVMGLFGNVNYFAEYLILPLSLTIGLILSKNKIYNKIFLFIALIAMGLTLFFTFTRGSYLAMAINIPVMLFLYFKSAKNEQSKTFYKKIILSLLLLATIALSTIYIPHPLNKDNTILGKLRERVTLESLTSGRSALRRIATWKFTQMMIKDYPLLGSGIGTYAYHTLEYQADFFSKGNNRDIYPHGKAVQAHNEYLQLWSELGIIGLILFLWIIFAYYRNVFIKIRQINENQQAVVIALTGGITAVLVDAIFGFPLQLAASIALFWVFLGLTSVLLNMSAYNDNDNYAESTFCKNSQKEKKFDIVKKSSNEDNRNKIIILKKIFLSFLMVVFMFVSVFLLFKPFLARICWYYGDQQMILEDNYKDAIKYYEKGLKWNPWQGELYFNIASILANKDIYQPALEYYHKAEKYIDDHYLPYNIASLYLVRQEYDKAIPYFEKAIKYQPDKINMLSIKIQLANIYNNIGDYKNAEYHFVDVLKSNPKSAEAYYGLAGVYINQDRKEEAIKALKKIIEIAPESKIAEYAKTMLIKLEIEP